VLLSVIPLDFPLGISITLPSLTMITVSQGAESSRLRNCPPSMPAPVHRYRRIHRPGRHGPNPGPVGNQAVILAPRSLLRISDQVLPGDVVVMPDLGRTETGEVRTPHRGG
jgi:hypothetical protein